MRTRLLRSAGLALGLLALGATACSSPLSSCGLLAVAVQPQDSLTVTVGATDTLLASVISGCPASVGPAIDFSISDTSVASVAVGSSATAPGDTALALVTGKKAGQTTVVATAHDRTNIRTGVRVVVSAPPTP